MTNQGRLELMEAATHVTRAVENVDLAPEAHTYGPLSHEAHVLVTCKKQIAEKVLKTKKYFF